MSNAWTIQTAIAERTERVVVGTLGTNPYTTDPSEIATHLATLDLLSGGRAALGLGLHTTSMVEWLGLDASDVVERTRAAVAIVRALLRGETVTREGPYAWGEECSLRFEPLRPDPPIHVAGFGSELLRLAGEIGDGAMPMATPPESVRDADRRGRGGSGGSRAAIPASSSWSRARGSRSPRTAAGTEDPLRPMIATFAPYLESTRSRRSGSREPSSRRCARSSTADVSTRPPPPSTPPMFDLALSGTPEDVAERIAALSDAGVTHVSLGGPLGPDPREAIRLLGERILPALRGLAPEIRLTQILVLRSAPTPSPRARSVRSRGRSRDRRSTARRSRSARR